MEQPIAMTQPDDSLAVLFADVSGSTRLYEKLGNAQALAAVARCLDLVRTVCEGRGGRVVKIIGDESMTVFRSIDDAVQAAADALTARSTRPKSQPAKIWLKLGEREIELTESQGALTLGRDLQCDMVIGDRMASRMHARIERRRDKFVLVDQSSNGTYVTVDGEKEILVRREELVLRGRGQICFGHAAQVGTTSEMLTFSCIP